jgi:hypothetical protein
MDKGSPGVTGAYDRDVADALPQASGWQSADAIVSVAPPAASLAWRSASPAPLEPRRTMGSHDRSPWQVGSASMPEPDALDAIALIHRGYFPRELPPPFTTALFAQFAGAVDTDGAAAPRLTECVRHNLARAGGQRRAQKIPNPENFLDLALLLEDVWPELEDHFGLGDLSISRPTVSSAGRAIAPEYRLGEAPRFRAQHWSTGRFVLKADITQFYPSLYTHGIPWALHGSRWRRPRNRKAIL